jgi:hypothetical protein
MPAAEAALRVIRLPAAAAALRRNISLALAMAKLRNQPVAPPAAVRRVARLARNRADGFRRVNSELKVYNTSAAAAEEALALALQVQMVRSSITTAPAPEPAAVAVAAVVREASLTVAYLAAVAAAVGYRKYNIGMERQST